MDLETGQRKWHYQLVHHGIWDMDIPCAPMLVDITVNGRPSRLSRSQPSRRILYVFDRVTGKPIWPIEEKPVPKGDVPGEMVFADAAHAGEAAGHMAVMDSRSTT